MYRFSPYNFLAEIISQCPAGPGFKEKPLGSARQRALRILCTVHAIDGVFDRRGFGNQTLLGFIPSPHCKKNVEGNRVPLHQCGDFLLLLLHHSEQRKFFLAGVISGDTVMLFFFLVDFLAHRKRVEIDRDGVVKQAQTREPMDDSGIGRLGPAGQNNNGMVTPIHEETKVRLPVALGMPAVFLNG